MILTAAALHVCLQLADFAEGVMILRQYSEIPKEEFLRQLGSDELDAEIVIDAWEEPRADNPEAAEDAIEFFRQKWEDECYTWQ